MKFEIEQILPISSRAQTYVLARQIEPAGWTLSDNARLGGVPIENWTDIPTAHDAQGSQRLDLFAFVLRYSAMAAQFSVGKVVELEP